MQNSGSNTDVTSTLSSETNQQGRLGAVAPKKSIETIIQRTDSKSKRSEGGLEDGDQQSICSASESSESLLLSMKKKDRGSECSHKVIEKRRRDRINTSLGELSHLLPAQSNGKQGSGKLEKAEILELTVEYLKSLQSRLTEQQEKDVKKGETTETDPAEGESKDVEVKPVTHFGGYKDCTEEVFRFLVNVEALDMQQPCFQRLMAHLRHQIQLMAESQVSPKGKSSGDGGKRATSKRSFQGTTSSSSSTSSSNGERSGSGSGGKAKRARHGHHSSSGDVLPSSSSNGNTSNSSDNENSSENSRENQTDSAICLDEEMSEIQGNSGKEAENGNRTNGNGIKSSNGSRGGDTNGSSVPTFPSMLPQAGNIPLRTPFLPPPYTLPTYALHPAGTHFIPVVLHPNIPLPTPSTQMFNGNAQMPFPMVQPGATAYGVSPHVPSPNFGFPLPYVHAGMTPYGYQAPPMGFPLFNGLRKDLGGQGTANQYNGDSGSNGDDCSIESRNSSESIAIQTDSSGNESSNPDEGGG